MGDILRLSDSGPNPPPASNLAAPLKGTRQLLFALPVQRHRIDFFAVQPAMIKRARSGCSAPPCSRACNVHMRITV